MTRKMKLGSVSLEIDFERFGNAKIIVALLLIFSFVFVMGQQLINIADQIPDSKLKAGIAFLFIVVGLVTFLDEE